MVVGHEDLADHLLGAGGDASVILIGGSDDASSYEALIAQAPLDPSLLSGAGPELVFYTSGTTARPKGVVTRDCVTLRSDTWAWVVKCNCGGGPKTTSM